MESTPLPRWILRSAWLLSCAWPLSLHTAILMDAADWAPWLTALAAALAALLWALAVHRLYVMFFAAGIIVFLAALVVTAPMILLFAPPVIINLVLAVIFGMSLLAQRTPVISVFARLEQGELPADLTRYTRQLTWIWTIFFVTMAVTAIILALFGPVKSWSFFTNVVNYMLVVLLFVGEFLYRRRRFRHYHHATLLELVQNVRGAGLLSRQKPAR